MQGEGTTSIQTVKAKIQKFNRILQKIAIKVKNLNNNEKRIFVGGGGK